MTFNHTEFKLQCRIVNADQIAKVIGKSRQAVSRKLNKKNPITVDEFLKICKLINKDPDEFINKGENE